MSKDPKSFVKNFKKSYDYPDVLTVIDAKDQQAAEEGTPKSFLDRISSQMLKGNSIHKIQLQKGVLTLAVKGANLYAGFFTDGEGQIVEKFDGHTLELVAKTLMVKGRVTDFDLYGESEDFKSESPIAAQTVISSNQPQITIKFGDVEIQLRKSIKQFVDSFRNERIQDGELLKKAIKSWRRSQTLSRYESDKEAAQAIIANWEIHKESFSQTLFAISQMSRK